MCGTVSSSYPDEDVTVETTYNADGAVATLVAKNPTTGDQTTKYVHGTTLADSTIARADLLRAVIHPDSDDTTSPLGDGADALYDRVEYKYNRQGQRTDAKDQNGSVHQYDFDKRGRLLHDRVTTLATGVDGAVRRQSTYDNAAVGSGSVVNQVQFAYNSFAQATTEYQEHGGAVNTSTSVKVQQAFADGSAGHVRPTKATYPNGRILRYEYNSGTDDAINRMSFLADDSSGSIGTHLAAYAYLGQGGIASEDFTQPQVKLDYDTAADGTFVGFDRFDRVLTHLWRDYGASADRDKFTYSHDRAGNRLYRENAVPSALDEFYTYDNVNRLTVSKRGDLNAGKTAISGTPVREEDFTLDMTGNWPTYVQKTSSTTTLNQSRGHNAVNEVTSASSWATPAHDRVGNMTTVPKPSSLANGLTLKFDAWNRVVEVKDGATVVGKYEYDAAGRRVKRHIDSQSPSGPNGIDRYEHLFYDDAQVIETRGTTTVSDHAENLQPKYQYVWSLRYIDAPVLRDENTDNDSLCDDARLYFLNDANMNVTSLVDTAGDALERYVYDPYGRLTIYNAAWSATRSTSSYSNTTLYTGRDLDPESALYFYRARYYTAELGRFVSRDPIWPEDGYDAFYAYVSSNPLGAVDPSGHQQLRYRAILVASPVAGISIKKKKGYKDLLRDHSCILLETLSPRPAQPQPGPVPLNRESALFGDYWGDDLVPYQTSIELLSAMFTGRTKIAEGPVGTVNALLSAFAWAIPDGMTRWGIFVTPGQPCTAMDNQKNMKAGKVRSYLITPTKKMKDKELNECLLREAGNVARESNGKREYYIVPWPKARTCNSVTWEIIKRCQASVNPPGTDLPGWGNPFSREKADPAW